MSEQPESREPTPNEVPVTEPVPAVPPPPPPAPEPASTPRDRFPAWSRYLAVGLAGLVLGGLLGWGITATALHDSGPGDGRGNFRHYGPNRGPGQRFGPGGPGWFNGYDGRNGGPVTPNSPSQPSQTPSPGVTS